MTLTDFFIKWLGKPLDYDKAYEGQCVDVSKAYMDEVLRLSPYYGDAIDYWTDPPKGFTKIENTPFNKPRPGDLVIWSLSFSPKYGHIGICNWSNLFFLNVFEQIGSTKYNPTFIPCRYKTRTYSNILGWLRPPLRATMRYTCFNADPSLMEEARKILYRLSDGKIDCSFIYKTHERTEKGVFTSDQQAQFVKSLPIQTPFVYYFYDSKLPYYSQMATASVLNSRKIMTAATPYNWTPLLVCYEFVNALSKLPGVPGDQDINTPTESFIKMKLDEIIPVLEGGVQI